MIRDAGKKGYAMMAGVEPEFITMQWDESGYAGQGVSTTIR